MFVAIYSFIIKPQQEEQFIFAWQELTKLIHQHENALESRLHKKSYSEYSAYARWPDKEIWEKAGATTAYERAVAKAKWILDNHKPDPLPDEVLGKIRALIDETEKELGINTTGESK